MTIRQMTDEEVQAHGTFGPGWGSHSRAYTDDTGGVVLFPHPWSEVNVQGRLPGFDVNGQLHFRVVLAKVLVGVNPHSDTLRQEVAELRTQLAVQYPTLNKLQINHALVNYTYEIWIQHRQVVRGRLRDALFIPPSGLIDALLPRVCEVVLRAARLEVLQARQKHVEREATQILNQIASNLWSEAARAVNYQVRHDALREERRGAYAAARLALALRAREELAGQIDDPEVLEAVIAGVADVGQPTTLILND